ncbi:MAG: hypothetical protein U0R50_17680 [Gaiellales bacterium]
MAAMDESNYLRDLIYLDWEKAASIFSQLHGGLLKETQESAESERQKRLGLGVSLGPVRPDVGGSAAERSSTIETRVMHHDLLLAIERALFKGGAAIDLTAYDSAADARNAAMSSAYLRAEGWVSIEDNTRIDHMTAHFLEVVDIMRRSALMGIEGHPTVVALRSQIEDAKKAVAQMPKDSRPAARQQASNLERQLAELLSHLTSEVIEGPPPQTLDDIRTWIRVFSPGRILARVYPFEDEPAHHVVAALKRDCFVDSDIENLLLVYGTRPNVKLTVFGLVTSVPNEIGTRFDPMVEYPDDDDNEENDDTPADFERVFRGMFGGMEGIGEFATPNRYPRITIFPIAIYRRVAVSDPA